MAPHQSGGHSLDAELCYMAQSQLSCPQPKLCPADKHTFHCNEISEPPAGAPGPVRTCDGSRSDYHSWKPRGLCPTTRWPAATSEAPWTGMHEVREAPGWASSSPPKDGHSAEELRPPILRWPLGYLRNVKPEQLSCLLTPATSFKAPQRPTPWPHSRLVLCSVHHRLTYILWPSCSPGKWS